jgi:hypothetical protein
MAHRTATSVIWKSVVFSGAMLAGTAACNKNASSTTTPPPAATDDGSATDEGGATYGEDPCASRDRGIEEDPCGGVGRGFVLS